MTSTHHAMPSSASVWLRFCAAYAALNAPHWVLGHWLFINRPFFDIELVLPLLIAAWSLPAAALATGIFWAVDLAVSQAHSYHFVSPLEFLRSARFLTDVHVGQFITAERLLMALPFAIFFMVALWSTPRQRVPWRPAFAIAAVLSLLDIANGSSLLSQRDTRWVAANIANSPSVTLAIRAWNERHRTAVRALPAGESATAEADVIGWATKHRDASVLIVIVESMGVHADKGLRDWLRDQVLAPEIQTRYTFREVIVPFQGSTTFAELRELCNFYGSYRSLTETNGANCLPAWAARQGWQTFGLHGFSSHMFDRKTWWPLLGLQTLRFAEDVTGAGEARCGGAFAGLCDARLIEAAVAEAKKPRRLVYALTLNSHLPLSPIEVPSDLQRRCFAAKSGEDVCRLTATIGIALRALRDGLLSSESSPEVVVVGDHAPPFVSLRDRDQYDQTKVPAFILVPR